MSFFCHYLVYYSSQTKVKYQTEQVIIITILLTNNQHYTIRHVSHECIQHNTIVILFFQYREIYIDFHTNFICILDGRIICKRKY